MATPFIVSRGRWKDVDPLVSSCGSMIQNASTYDNVMSSTNNILDIPKVFQQQLSSGIPLNILSAIHISMCPNLGPNVVNASNGG